MDGRPLFFVITPQPAEYKLCYILVDATVATLVMFVRASADAGKVIYVTGIPLKGHRMTCIVK